MRQDIADDDGRLNRGGTRRDNDLLRTSRKRTSLMDGNLATSFRFDKLPEFETVPFRRVSHLIFSRLFSIYINISLDQLLRCLVFAGPGIYTAPPRPHPPPPDPPKLERTPQARRKYPPSPRKKFWYVPEVYKMTKVLEDG